jgi:hypothetical protein
MAQATYEPTTSETDMNKIWHKVQGPLMIGFNFMSEEYEMLDSLKQFKIDWSAREIIVPLELNEGAGVASIPEGGWEAVPSSPTVEEISLSWILLNKRFTATLTAMYIDQKNQEAMIRRQIVFQGKTAVQAIGSDFADRFYGFSTGILALVANTESAGTNVVLDLDDGYGVAGIDDAAFIVDKFKVGDRIALIRSAALVTNGIGTVTARDKSAGTLDVTFIGSVTATANDAIVKANSMENTTLAGTDYNRSLVGLLDMATSVTVHGLANTTNENWDVALNDSTAARFDTVYLLQAQDAIADNGGGNVTDILMSRGVYRDALDNQLGSLRFDSPFNLQLDGELKAKGVKITRTKRVPPGYVFAFDKSSLHKMTLLRKPSAGSPPQWRDSEKIPDRSGRVFSIDFPVATVITNRGNMVVMSGKAEQ